MISTQNILGWSFHVTFLDRNTSFISYNFAESVLYVASVKLVRSGFFIWLLIKLISTARISIPRNATPISNVYESITTSNTRKLNNRIASIKIGILYRSILFSFKNGSVFSLCNFLPNSKLQILESSYTVCLNSLSFMRSLSIALLYPSNRNPNPSLLGRIITRLLEDLGNFKFRIT